MRHMKRTYSPRPYGAGRSMSRSFTSTRTPYLPSFWRGQHPRNRQRIKLVLLVVIIVLAFHTHIFGLDVSRLPLGDALSSHANFVRSYRARRPSIFPPLPADIQHHTPPPVLVSTPNSSTSAFTRHHHAHPYPGLAIHFSTAIHPSKDVLDHTHYLLGSKWMIEQDGNTDWMRIGVQGLLPTSAPYLSFTCEYAKKGSDEWEEVEARTMLQGRKEYVHVECALPSWSRIDKANSTTQELTKQLAAFKAGRTRIRAWMEMADETFETDDKWQEWRRGVVDDAAVTRVNGTATHVLIATQEFTSAQWRHSDPAGNKLGVCLSPVWLGNDESKLESKLKDFIEWRIWHQFGGVDVVHWSARDASFGRWVEKLNAVLGLHDTFLPAPHASDTYLQHNKPYGDQVMYLADCLLRHGVTDEYLAMTDLDEYMMTRDDPSPYGIVRRLQALPGKVGTFSIDHTYFGLDPIARASDTSPVGPPAVSAFPKYPRNAYNGWDTLEKPDGYRRQKSIYRSAATKAIWVHSHTELGAGFWRTDDKTGIRPDKGDYPSQLELMHDREPVPVKLVIEKEVEGDMAEKWTGIWREMGEVLKREELEELWDVRLVLPEGGAV